MISDAELINSARKTHPISALRKLSQRNNTGSTIKFQRFEPYNNPTHINDSCSEIVDTNLRDGTIDKGSTCASCRPNIATVSKQRSCYTKSNSNENQISGNYTTFNHPTLSTVIHNNLFTSTNHHGVNHLHTMPRATGDDISFENVTVSNIPQNVGSDQHNATASQDDLTGIPTIANIDAIIYKPPLSNPPTTSASQKMFNPTEVITTDHNNTASSSVIQRAPIIGGANNSSTLSTVCIPCDSSSVNELPAPPVQRMSNSSLFVSADPAQHLYPRLRGMPSACRGGNHMVRGRINRGIMRRVRGRSFASISREEAQWLEDQGYTAI